jgi:hypothetical protein
MDDYKLNIPLDDKMNVFVDEKPDRRKVVARKNYEIYQRDIEAIHASIEVISNDMDNNEENLCLLILRKSKLIRLLRSKLTIQFPSADYIVDMSCMTLQQLSTILYEKCKTIEKLEKLLYRQLRAEQRKNKQLLSIRGWEQAVSEHEAQTLTTESYSHNTH